MKSIESFFDAPMGGYAGVLIREKKAKKLAKLLYKQNQEVKELLASDLDDLEVSHWTLAYPKGEQTGVTYYSEHEGDSAKLHRISLLDKSKLMRYCEKGVFIADTMDEAEDAYMEWFNNTNILEEEKL